MISLDGKTVLVTGASAGIGEACVRAFASLGARVIAGARRLDRLERLAQELMENGKAEVLPLRLDVTDYKGVRDAIDGLPADWSEIDILVNNAGLSRRLDPVYGADVADWDEMIDTNVKGLLYVTRLVLPGMRQRDRGHIVNLGSIAGIQAYPGGSVYCASKHAVRALSEAMRLDLNGTSIRVTLIEPGMTKTEFQLVRWRGDEARARDAYRGVDCLTAEDIADIIVFCVTRPAHVDISEVVVMPTQQASTTLMHRRAEPATQPADRF